jgi:CheY-like chemotaxis protein
MGLHVGVGKTVLIVDDSPHVRDTLGLVFQLYGFGVGTAADGREALDYLHRYPPPCLIVLDLMMPGMDGRQFRAAQLRDPALAQIPVVVCSALADRTDPADFAGVRGLLTKPVDPAVLVALTQPGAG